MNKLFFVFILFVGFLALNPYAHADAVANINSQGRVFPSQTKVANVTVDLEGSQAVINVGGRKRRAIKLSKEMLLNGDFYVSDDGDWVLWVLKAFTHQSWSRDKHRNSNAAVILFHNENEVARLLKSDIGFEGGYGTVSHYRWAESIDVDFPNKLITLSEVLDKKLNRPTKIVEARFDTGNFKITTKEGPKPPADDTVKPQGGTAPAAPTSGQAMVDVVQWYQDEVVKLNAKADAMSDKELNAAMEKLLADYNRKILKLTAAAMPNLGAKATEPEDPALRKKSPQLPYRVPLKFSYEGFYIEFSYLSYYRLVPGNSKVPKTPDKDKLVFAMWPTDLPPGTSLDVAPSISIAVKPFKAGEDAIPGAPVNPHGFLAHLKPWNPNDQTIIFFKGKGGQKDSVKFEVKLNFMADLVSKGMADTIIDTFQAKPM